MCGGNIVCVTRSLVVASAAHRLLHERTGGSYLGAVSYRSLYEQVVEMRGAIGV